MTTFELGPGLLALLGSVVTTTGGILVLWLSQRREFKKAETARSSAKQLVVEDGAKKDAALKDIHTLVNSRLTRVLQENAEFKMIITDLIAAKHTTRAEQAATEANAEARIK